jgi:hypothetical protein
MGAGSVFGAVFVLPWTRQRLSSNASTVLANFLVALVYLLMAFVQQPSIFMIVAALAGIGWTLGSSELWVAGQRAIPGWARRRMSALLSWSPRELEEQHMAKAHASSTPTIPLDLERSAFI